MFTADVEPVWSDIKKPGNQECQRCVQLLRHLDEHNLCIGSLSGDLNPGPMAADQNRDSRGGVVHDVEFTKDRFLEIPVGNVPQLWGAKTQPILLPLQALCVMKHLVGGDPAMSIAEKFDSSSEVREGRECRRGSKILMMSTSTSRSSIAKAEDVSIPEPAAGLPHRGAVHALNLQNPVRIVKLEGMVRNMQGYQDPTNSGASNPCNHFSMRWKVTIFGIRDQHVTLTLFWNIGKMLVSGLQLRQSRYLSK